jgi:hypothetical protein
MTKPQMPEKTSEEIRKARLAEQLRANLQRRKRQARSRREGEADERAEGISAATRDQKD